MSALMIDVAGVYLSAAEKQKLAHKAVAGVILFARNIGTANDVRALTDSIRNVREDLVIAVDQEGGRVARLRGGFSKLPSMAQIGAYYKKDASFGKKLAHQTAFLMACEVLAVGVDISFAPVLDIDKHSLVIGDRAFGADIDACTVLGGAFIDGMHKAGMVATGKHFPGHGSVVEDSHVSCAQDLRKFDEIWHNDMQVFVKNLYKLDALMPAHVVYPNIDNQPAGFSSIWLKKILRQQLSFDGVLFSDDLSMQAATAVGDMRARVKAALSAGCDVALICNAPNEADLVLKAYDDVSQDMPKIDFGRLKRLKSSLPNWCGNLTDTAAKMDGYIDAKQLVQTTFGA